MTRTYYKIFKIHELVHLINRNTYSLKKELKKVSKASCWTYLNTIQLYLWKINIRPFATLDVFLIVRFPEKEIYKQSSTTITLKNITAADFEIKYLGTNPTWKMSPWSLSDYPVASRKSQHFLQKSALPSHPSLSCGPWWLNRVPHCTSDGIFPSSSRRTSAAQTNVIR